MKIGFTGTQHGMTWEQRQALTKLLLTLQPTEFHHGDCIGADAEAHEAAVRAGVPKIVIHPPLVSSKRYYCVTGKELVVLPEKPYLIRNHDIVNQTDLLIAAPMEITEVLRSGTWATIRYARNVSKPIKLLLRQ